MPDREYFSLRYAVPGFSFILIVLGLNYSPIVRVLVSSGQPNNNVLPIVVSIVSLFSGSAIGFLVAQIWFWYYHWRRVYVRINKGMKEVMCDELEWEPKGEGKEKDVTMSAFLDYILLVGKKEMVWSYCQRRWDLFHVLSGTIVSLILAAIVGLILRVILSVLFVWGDIGKVFSAIHQFSIGKLAELPMQAKADVLLAIFTLVIVAALVKVIWYGRSKVFNEYNKVLRAFVSSKESDEDFIKALRFFGIFSKSAHAREKVDPRDTSVH